MTNTEPAIDDLREEYAQAELDHDRRFWYRPTLEIHASLSRCNSRDDAIDNLLYEEMVERICKVANDPQYARINVDLASTGIDWQAHP